MLFRSYSGKTLSVDTTSASFGISTGWAQTSTITLVASSSLTLNQGDTIQIAGVYGVNPQSRQSYGKLRNFVVTATTTVATGGGTQVTVSPAIITGGQFQNVTVTATSATAVVTPFNNTGVTSPQNLVFHKNFATLATAEIGRAHV